MAGELVERRHLIADIDAGRDGNPVDAFAAPPSESVEHVVVRFHGETEEVDARVELAAPQVRVLEVAERDDSAVQQRQLHVAVEEVEVQDVETADGQRIVERWIDVRAKRERARRRGHLVADHPRLPFLHEVPNPLVGVAVHDAVRRAGRRSHSVEVRHVQGDVREVQLPLDEDAAAGDEEHLLADQMVHQPRGTSRKSAGLRVDLRLVVRHDRTGQLRLHCLDLEPDEAAPIDPHRTAVERPPRIDRIETDDERGPSADRLDAVQAICVVLVQPEIEGQRKHLLRLHERKRRSIRRPFRAVQLEAQLLPLDADAVSEQTVLRHDVVRRIRG